MPLYVCNAKKGAIPEASKAAIAKDITDIHCEVTAAPPTFVHVFFLEDADNPPLGDKDAFVFGSIRAGRTDDQKREIVTRARQSIRQHAGIAEDAIAAVTIDLPASWAMEDGELLPEPGEEAEWLAAHSAH